MNDFWKGFIAGAAALVIIVGIIAGLVYLHYRDRETLEYAEKQQEIEAVKEDYSNRDPIEYLEDIPDVRTAADGAAAEFDRERDAAVQRFRSQHVDR
jgi:anionic cell wall polymer biosynthesis LytR-Cps2A-Psr (LCP) family protein